MVRPLGAGRFVPARLIGTMEESLASAARSLLGHHLAERVHVVVQGRVAFPLYREWLVRFVYRDSVRQAMVAVVISEPEMHESTLVLTAINDAACLIADEVAWADRIAEGCAPYRGRHRSEPDTT